MLVDRCAGCRMGTDASQALPGRGQTVVTPEATAPRAAASACRPRRQDTVDLPTRGIATTCHAYRPASTLEARNRWSTSLSDVSTIASALSASSSRLSVATSILGGREGSRKVKISAAQSWLSGLQGRVGGESLKTVSSLLAGGAGAGAQTRTPRR